LNTLARASASIELQKLKEARRITWRDIPITDKEKLRTALIMKHKSLTEAGVSLNVGFPQLSDVLNSRRQTIHVIKAIQADLNLSDEQVLKFWPLLRAWPRKSKTA